MKKIVIPIFASFFLLVALGAGAKEDKNATDISKILEAKGIKLEKKIVLAKEERTLREKGLKGKPASSDGQGGKVPISGATGVLGQQLPLGAQKYAVVIGLSNYIGTVNDLCVDKTAETYPINLCEDGDAKSMESSLVNEYGYDPANVSRFSDADANLADIKLAVDSIVARANPGDEIVFFFSGHSATSSRSVDDDKESIDEGIVLYDGTVVWDGNIRSWFSNLRTNRAVFIFDTCKAGGMNDLQMDGRVLALSSAENQYSYTYYLRGEDGQVGEGMFTHYFVNEGMREGLADGYNALGFEDYGVAIEEALVYSKNFVPQMTQGNQMPVLNDKFLNDLFLGK